MIWIRIGLNGLMVALGVLILVQGLRLGAWLNGSLVGGGLIVLGLYRFRVFLRAARGRP